ncbi:hypothetical protein ERO13_A08G157032v2 [Gossypium hirsutum]|nr:hypothetical protein ERO13_A08G157032v2 [Gossypium hirsutum]
MRSLGLHQTPTKLIHPLFVSYCFLLIQLPDVSLVYAIKHPHNALKGMFRFEFNIEL